MFVSVFVQTWPAGIQCQICYMMFNDQSAINAHYDTAHAPRERADAKYECNICGKKVMRKGTLRQHLAKMHGLGDIRKFPCDICSHVFYQKNNLTRHMKTVHATHWAALDEQHNGNSTQ